MRHSQKNFLSTMTETTTNLRDAPAGRLVRSVVLVGMMGAGKTAVGRVLAGAA